MSYRDHYQGSVAASGQNGRPRVATGNKSPIRSGWELVAWALLEMAIDDTTILCRYGLIRRNGSLRKWPRVKRTDNFGHHHYDPMTIATMNDPMEHIRLKDFWNDETQAQMWCDLCGCNLPAKEIWQSILKHHAQ